MDILGVLLEIREATDRSEPVGRLLDVALAIEREKRALETRVEILEKVLHAHTRDGGDDHTRDDAADWACSHCRDTFGGFNESPCIFCGYDGRSPNDPDNAEYFLTLRVRRGEV